MNSLNEKRKFDATPAFVANFSMQLQFRLVPKTLFKKLLIHNQAESNTDAHKTIDKVNSLFLGYD